MVNHLSNLFLTVGWVVSIAVTRRLAID